MRFEHVLHPGQESSISECFCLWPVTNWGVRDELTWFLELCSLADLLSGESNAFMAYVLDIY